jgi:two-component system sensor histidine kinase BaeS
MMHPAQRKAGIGMPQRLTVRVVAVIALVAATVVVVDTMAARWAFRDRFLAYVNDRDLVLVETLAERLAERFASRGSWAALDEEQPLPELLRSTLRAASRELAEQPDGTRGGADGERGGPQPRHRGRSVLGRLSLLDADGRRLVEPRSGDPGAGAAQRRPILVAGRTVGVLELRPALRVDRALDQRFEEEHLRALWWIAALVALLATVAGWALSRSLLAPVNAVTAAMRALAAGRYETRLPVARRDELGTLARDVNLLADALERSQDARQRWLADVAHELRTPLTILRGEIEALVDGVRPLDASSLASLDAETTHLSRLVDDLQALALADAGALAFRYAPTPLAPLVEEIVARHETRFAQASLRLGCVLPEDALTLPVDADRIEQLLANLLENALRYTDAPGEVRVTLTASGDGARLTVEDSPPGVPSDALPRLFERFWRLDAARGRARGGSGLGLAIVRAIAEAHGGRVSARAGSLGGLAVDVELGTLAKEWGHD